MTVEQILEAYHQLSPADQRRFEDEMFASNDLPDPDQTLEPLTDEEIAELTKIQPLTGAQIVERGLTGGWADMGITDSLEWVLEQKRKRRNKHKW